MYITKIIRSGKLTLHIKIEEELEPYFTQVESHFLKAKTYNSEKIYRIKLIRISRKDSSKNMNSARFKKLFFDHFRYFQTKYADSHNKPLLLKQIFWAFSSKDFCKLVQRGNEPKKHDLFIRSIRKNWLLALDLAISRGLIIYRSEKNTPFSIAELSLMIQYLIENLIPEIPSFVLHASAVKFNNKGNLFLGANGAGKSTVAKILLENLCGAKMVADDMTVITPDRNNRSFYASPLRIETKDYAGKISNIQKAKSMKINRIYFLHKSKKLIIKQCDKFAAFKEIMSKQLNSYFWFKDHSKEAVIIFLKLIRKCPVQHLYFKKNPSFIKLLLR
jgi:hypothetical protein